MVWIDTLILPVEVELFISVVLKSYVVYGQLPDCEETVANTTGNNTDPNATAEDITYLHFCDNILR